MRSRYRINVFRKHVLWEFAFLGYVYVLSPPTPPSYESLSRVVEIGSKNL
jgi:hypothetical protein